MKTLLRVENIFYSYDKKEVLKNISLEIKEGEFFVLLGLNGAGKSTLFSLITRLLSLQDGKIFINSYSLTNYKKALKNIGIVFQESSLDLDLSIRQNLFFYACIQGVNFKEAFLKIQDELKALDLLDKLDIKIRDLNQGHRRRVEILRSLINDPKILLLDEATVGLDVKSRFDILEFIRLMVKNRNICVLWITHLFDEVKGDDKVALMKDGEIIENCLLEEMLIKHNKKSLNEVFSYLTKARKEGK